MVSLPPQTTIQFSTYAANEALVPEGSLGMKPSEHTLRDVNAKGLTPFPWVLEGPLTALVIARNRWAFGRAMSRVSPCMESLGRSLHLYLTVPRPSGAAVTGRGGLAETQASGAVTETAAGYPGSC